MPLIDTYRNRVNHLNAEIIKLTNDVTRENSKITKSMNRINSAERTLKRTKSQTTVKSKLSEIERENKKINEYRKKIDSFENKIGKKRKDLQSAKEKLDAEELKEENKRQKTTERQIGNVIDSLQDHEIIQNQLADEIEQLKKIPDKITVLFLASNPVDSVKGSLRLDEEARSITERIRMSEYRDSVTFETRWAVRASDVLQAINETKPTIVHFSGHGTELGEIVLENSAGGAMFVSKESISAAIYTASDTIELVVFNACFSEEQALNVTQNIKAAIGMSDSIGDQTACIFAAQLYSSIGFGLSLKKSFDQAIAALKLEGIPEDITPKLYSRSDVDLDEIILVNPE